MDGSAPQELLLNGNTFRTFNQAGKYPTPLHFRPSCTDPSWRAVGSTSDQRVESIGVVRSSIPVLPRPSPRSAVRCTARYGINHDSLPTPACLVSPYFCLRGPRWIGTSPTHRYSFSSHRPCLSRSSDISLPADQMFMIAPAGLLRTPKLSYTSTVNEFLLVDWVRLGCDVIF